jgi:hypothetical protein
VLATFLATSSAFADSGTIAFRVFKGGWFIGGSAGNGALFFHGRSYPISIGGLSIGLVFGGSETRFRGSVTNIRRPSDVAGVYGAGGAGGALVVGAQVIVLRNEKGATLRLVGQQVGLQVNADVSGLAISMPTAANPPAESKTAGASANTTAESKTASASANATASDPVEIKPSFSKPTGGPALQPLKPMPPVQGFE